MLTRRATLHRPPQSNANNDDVVLKANQWEKSKKSLNATLTSTVHESAVPNLLPEEKVPPNKWQKTTKDLKVFAASKPKAMGVADEKREEVAPRGGGGEHDGLHHRDEAAVFYHLFWFLFFQQKSVIQLARQGGLLGLRGLDQHDLGNFFASEKFTLTHMNMALMPCNLRIKATRQL